MRVALLTREYPPEVYGGAGVHVEYLSEHLSGLVDLGVYCFGRRRESPLVKAAFEPWEAIGTDRPHDAALKTLSVDLLMAGAVEGADLVHTHTWYANFAGHLARLLYAALTGYWPGLPGADGSAPAPPPQAATQAWSWQ